MDGWIGVKPGLRNCLEQSKNLNFVINFSFALQNKEKLLEKGVNFVSKCRLTTHIMEMVSCFTMEKCKFNSMISIIFSIFKHISS